MLFASIISVELHHAENFVSRIIVYINGIDGNRAQIAAI